MDINQNNVFGPNNFYQFGKQARHINELIGTQLENFLEKDKKVIITAAMGDPEAFDFASETKVYLEKRGYSVTGINQALTMPPMRGQGVTKNKDGEFEIMIGAQI